MKKLTFVIITSVLLLLSCKENEDEKEEAKIVINYGNLNGKMAFGNGNNKITIIDFDSKSFSEVTPKDNALIWNGSVSLSPDGERIAYAGYSNGYGGYQIFTMSCTGGDFKQLTKDISGLTKHYTSPIWNDDGSKVYYVEAGLILGGPVYWVSPNGENNTKIADYDLLDRVDVSKNEAFILMAFYGIHVYDVQNKFLKKLVSIDPTYYGYCPIFSPDEKKIAYVLRHGVNDYGNPPYYFKIKIMNTDGTDEKTILTVDENLYFGKLFITWSPDGTKLAFNGNGSHIYTINTDGTELTQITNSGYDAGPSWIK